MKTLVIGYGNELRQDDGAGPRVARIVAGWGWRGLEATAVYQLTPELAEPISQVERVFFVDAGLSETVTARRLEPVPSRAWSHRCDPHGLLALARSLYAWRGEAWLVQVPARNLGFGEDLSTLAQQSIDKATELIRELVGELSCTRSA